MNKTTMNKKLPYLAKLSIFFTERYRFTILLLLATIGIGMFSYTTLLKREGFPNIDVPIGFISTPYFVDDVDLVDKEITQEIERAVSGLSIVDSVTSTTDANFSTVVISFSGDTSSVDGMKAVREEVNIKANLPEDVNPNFQSISASKFLGEYDLMLSVNADVDPESLQNAATIVSDYLAEQSGIGTSEIIPLEKERTNPITGESFIRKEVYTRNGLRENNELKFLPGVIVGITKKSDAIDTLKISEIVRESIDELFEDNEELEDFEIIYTADFAESVNQQIASLENNVLTGLIAVVLVLFLFISWRAAILGAIFIPTVLSATFVGLYLIGYSLNVLSLFALILVLGLFVDDAIVIIESIDYQRKKGIKGTEAIAEAIKDVGTADILGTITTLLVFVPMVFTSGILGDFIKKIPITVILALSLSLIIALTLIPFLSRIILLPGDPKHPANKYIEFGSTILSKVGEIIGNVVRTYMQNAILTVIVLITSILLIIGGTRYAGLLPFSIFPSPDDTESITYQMTLPDGLSIDEAEQIAVSVEQRIVGKYEDSIETFNYYQADRKNVYVQIYLVDVNDRDILSKELIVDLNNMFSSLESVQFRAQQESAGPPISEFPFAVQIYDADTTKLASITSELIDFIKNQQPLDGITVEKVSDINTDIISKQDQQRFVEIRAKFNTEENITAINLELQTLIEKEFTEAKLLQYDLKPDAITFDFGQETENLESFNSAIFALFAALIVMYALLVLQYNSFLQPLLIFVAIPLSFPGLFPGLYATGNSLSFFVALGITGLVGIVVNNTIILIDYANQIKRANKKTTTAEAISQAVAIRFRPILTTTVTTIAGLLPLALTDPFWESLAYSIIFGLISSTIMVLLIFPAWYGLFEKIREYRNKVLPFLE